MTKLYVNCLDLFVNSDFSDLTDNEFRTVYEAVIGCDPIEGGWTSQEARDVLCEYLADNQPSWVATYLAR